MPVSLRLRHLRAVLAVVGLMGLFVSARAAHADTAPSPTDERKTLAMEKYGAGSRAFSEKRYKDAIDLFLEADALVQDSAFAFNASAAYEAMGDAAASLRWAREYLFRSPAAEDTAAVEARIRRFEVLLKEKGLQQLTVRSSPAGATVLIDGKAVGVSPWTSELAPGEHFVELRLRGHRDVREPFALPADASFTLTLTLTDVTPEVVVAPPILTTPPERGGLDAADPPATWLLPTAVGIGGTGVLTLGAALVLELMRASAEDDARGAAIQVEAADAYERMEAYETGARVTAGIGSGLVLVGATLLVVDLLVTDPDSAPSVGVACSFTRCGVETRF